MNGVETSFKKRKKALETSKQGHRHLSRLHLVTEKEKLKVQEDAHSFASENPFFVICLNASDVNKSMQLVSSLSLSLLTFAFTSIYYFSCMRGSSMPSLHQNLDRV
jgi:hypothetical protein